MTPSGDAPAALDRARRDVAAGRPDLARERVTGYLYTLHRRGEYREDAYDLLGQICFSMKDYARAGAAWLLTSRTGAEVDQAIGAFHGRYGTDPVNVLKALKPRAPSEGYPPMVRERLKAWGYRYRPYRPRSNPHVLEEEAPSTTGIRPFEVGCLIFVLSVAATLVVFIFRWLRN